MADPTPDPKPDPKPGATAAPPASDPPIAAARLEDSYELVKQACAMAIQDAVAYLRNTELIANAVIGVAGQRLLNGDNDGGATAAIAAATASVASAAEALATISKASANTLTEFPHP
jgi:hypothetical protein